MSPTNDRLSLRVSALRLARQRRNMGEAAWAAARLRLKEAALDRSDAAFAHEAIVGFGHALRVARARRPHETGHEFHGIHDDLPVRRPISKRWLAVVLVAVLGGGVLLWPRLTTAPSGQAAGATPAGVAVIIAAASPLRGRSDLAVSVVATAAPTSAPSTAAATGAGGGGSGGGPPGPSAPVALPTPTEMLLDVTVFDARTRRPLSGVCVIDGLTTCTAGGAAITDVNGHAQLRLSIGQLWHLEFKRDGYLSATQDVYSNVASQSITAQLTPSR